MRKIFFIACIFLTGAQMAVAETSVAAYQPDRLEKAAYEMILNEDYAGAVKLIRNIIVDRKSGKIAEFSDAQMASVTMLIKYFRPCAEEIGLIPDRECRSN